MILIEEEKTVISIDSSKSSQKNSISEGGQSQSEKHKSVSKGGQSQSEKHKVVSKGNQSQSEKHKSVSKGSQSQSKEHKGVFEGGHSQSDATIFEDESSQKLMLYLTQSQIHTQTGLGIRVLGTSPTPAPLGGVTVVTSSPTPPGNVSLTNASNKAVTTVKESSVMSQTSTPEKGVIFFHIIKIEPRLRIMMGFRILNRFW